MPNWCNNKLTVFGPETELDRFKKQAVGSPPWGKPPDVEMTALNFHSLVPIPPDVIAAGYGQAGEDWERANWGCKWGACSVELVDQGHLEYEFDTAWSPPVLFLSKLAPKWPMLTFILDYEEIGVGFKGIAKAAGDAVEDHCLEL